MRTEAEELTSATDRLIHATVQQGDQRDEREEDRNTISGRLVCAIMRAWFAPSLEEAWLVLWSLGKRVV
ncbi:hypothetical protein L484_003098 [Morus notabilis]|uniref:Uncharacterized protein n=1 Tax=Morus notabilis TaxID=981085 RepID=W9QRR3_9ROSA|nr:hypothetical protein L484_003098 [Morus notabilis]